MPKKPNSEVLPLSTLDSLFDGFEDAVFILDTHRKVQYANSAAREWFSTNQIVTGETFFEPVICFHSRCYALCNCEKHILQPVQEEQIPQLLLQLHDLSHFLLLQVHESTFSWQGNEFTRLTLHNAFEQLITQQLQKAVFQISNAAAIANDLHELYTQVHEIIAALLPAPNLFIALYDEITEFISFPYYVDEQDYLPPNPEQQLRKRDRKVRRGLTEYLLHRREPLLITRTMLDELTDSGEISVVGSIPFVWLGIPLKTVQEKIIGGLVIQTYTEGVRYTEQDKNLLNFVSTQIAMAIERKQAEEKLYRERQLFALGPVVMFKLMVEDMTKRTMLYVSPNIEQFGYTPKQFLSGEIILRNIVHPDDLSRIFQFQSEVMQSGRLFFEQEYRIRTLNGDYRWIYDFTYMNPTKDNQLVEYNFYILDITDRKNAQEALTAANENLEKRVLERTAQLAESQSFLQLVIDTIPAPVFIQNKQGIYEGCNTAYENLIGIPRTELIGKSTFDIWPQEVASMYHQSDMELIANPGRQSIESIVALASGQDLDTVFYKATYEDATGEIGGLVGVMLDITERKRFEKLQNTLYLISEAASSAQSLEALFEFVHGVVSRLLPAKNFYIALYDAESDIVSFPYFKDEHGTTPQPRKSGNGLTEYVIRSGESFLLNTPADREMIVEKDLEPTGAISVQWLGVPLKTNKDTIIGVVTVQSYDESEINYTHSHQELLEFVSNQIALAIERKRAQEELRVLNMELEEKVAARTRQLNEQLVELRQRERELTTVVDLAQMLRQTHNRDEIYEIIQHYMLDSLGAQGVSLAIWDTEALELVYMPGLGNFQAQNGLRLPLGVGAAGWVIRNMKVYVNNDIQNDPGPVLTNLISGTRSLMIVPMIVDDQVIGMLEAGGERDWHEDDIRLLVALAEIAAYAIQRELLNEQKERQLQRLNILREIDRMITGNFDLTNIMSYLLNQIASQLNVDAADILIASENSSVIEYGRGIGFHQPLTREALVTIHPGPAEWVVVSGEPVSLLNVHQSNRWKNFFQQLKSEGFVSYYAVPLKTKGQILGILEVFRRSQININNDWEEFLNALAQQTAIAIENGQLIDKMQKANRELSYAYDRTIEGWAKALEIRDRVTSDHSYKVRDWTMILAQAMGIRNPEELIHIRRGALLHDIGKMGVPDDILQKPDLLTTEEWKTMRLHPKHAQDLLEPIEFLRPSMDIPVYHHERWDGSGYPFGFKGKEIPLSARIFAVVDVFNALISSRPYSEPWSREKAIAYIQDQANKQFDPDVVKVFLNYVHLFTVESEEDDQ
ncbi:MAG: hypothetical protein CVU39_18925 [Chloroflexi bacterium HGW-Chloroflexi-10]|nr:MAG: hypothetical protein CVU39_18925 [Chloroflexi bacterium HGW-Chloroflexi-10]